MMRGTFVDQLWKECVINDSPVLELWAKFLYYYTNVFKFKEEVVSVREISPMFEQQDQLNEILVIEDPFILQKNYRSKIQEIFSCALRNVDQFRVPENLSKR
ncbi:unnamed protein product [Didymodactylos carnosus]|uniref:PAP-associated domain-containing protein n=1 Tax=Didymodactylos carnosus TaxID=1234261 RepID=A0A815H390_9BILA|nr:unnamed protein product [Didymodactylos carnosus]CAF4212781.1 unnamed protein product [Didymodactylos carnosus]